MKNMRMLKMVVGNAVLATAVVAGAALMSFMPAANAVSYSTSGSTTQFSLGDTLGSDYDQLQINGSGGTINPGTIVLNTLVFTAGVNATVAQVYDGVFSFAETMTIGTGNGNLARIMQPMLADVV